jgi:hypothetical protein
VEVEGRGVDSLDEEREAEVDEIVGCSFILVREGWCRK